MRLLAATGISLVRSVTFGQGVETNSGTPKSFVGKHAALPEQAFWRQPVGKRIGRWYAKAAGGFPRAIALAQAAIRRHDRTNAHNVALEHAAGNFANTADDEETLRRAYFPSWNSAVFKDVPDFWSVTPRSNPSVLGRTHFPDGFKGFIVLSQELPVRKLCAVYDHELTHYYILSDKNAAVRAKSLDCLLPPSDVLDDVVRQVFGQLDEEKTQTAQYWLQPAEIDVTLSEIKRRYAFSAKKHLGKDLALTPAGVLDWWLSEGVFESLDSEEPATVAEEPDRLNVLAELPDALRQWLFKRMLEIV